MQNKKNALEVDIQHFAYSAGETVAITEQQGSMDDGECTPETDEAQFSHEQDEQRLESYRKFKAEHKREFDDEVQSIVRDRLKKSARETAQLQQRLDTLSPLVETLSQQYGVDGDDAQALANAIRDNNPKQLHANQIYNEWTRQAEQTKHIYPSFELAGQVSDPNFVRLIRAGVDIRTAYEVTHRDEVIAGAMKAGVERTQQKIADAVASGSLRPAENGLSGTAAVTTVPDPSKLSGQQLEQYKQRAFRGERIDFKSTY